MVKVMSDGAGTGRRSQVGARIPDRRQDRHGAGVHRRQNESYKAMEAKLSERLLDHGWFIAFAPADAPKIAVAVIIENGKHGTAAAAIARRVLDQYLLGHTTTPEIPPPIVAPTGDSPCRPKRRETSSMSMYEPIEVGSRSRRTFTAAGRILGALKLDGPLLVGLGLITLYGLVVLYSASGQNWNRVIDGAIRAALGGVAMCALAQVKPAFLRRLSLPLWVLGVILLIVVDITGHIGKGAQRWLDLGFIRFQPSEIMKLAVPMTCAWWLHDRPLPPNMSVARGARVSSSWCPPGSPSCSPISAPADSSSSAARWS